MMTWMKNTTLLLAVCLLMLSGCASRHGVQTVTNPVVSQQTIKGVGACRGVAVFEGSVWLYGDVGKGRKGVVRRLQWSDAQADGGPGLIDTGESYELVLYRNFTSRSDPATRLSPDLITHPTGLASHPKLGAFIGNTGNDKGTIFHIFWEGFTESGNLDDWVLNAIDDDLATHGTRPEYVRYDGRWLIATADDSFKNSKLRLYDPEKLAKAHKTSDPGVLIAEFDCGPFVQNLHWIDEENTLVLVQNRTPGRGCRLTLMKLGSSDGPPTVTRVIEMDFPTDTLAGFAVLAPGWAVLVSSSAEQNVSVMRWPLE